MGVQEVGRALKGVAATLYKQWATWAKGTHTFSCPLLHMLLLKILVQSIQFQHISIFTFHTHASRNMMLSAILTVPAMVISVCLVADYKGASGGTCVGLWDAFSPQACDVHCKISTYVHPTHPYIGLGPFHPIMIYFLKEILTPCTMLLFVAHLLAWCAVVSRTSSSSCSAPG